VSPRRQAPRVFVLAALAAGLALAAAAGPAGAQATCPWVTSTQPIAHRVAQVLARMTLADEISLVEGHGTSNPYVFDEPGIPRLCIPELGLEDGPAGVADGLAGVTQLPAGVALAATWDPALARAYGAVIGSEEWGKGAAVDLGPTVDIDRDPRWGRSFEAFTEDPFLNSELAVAEIDGVQSQRVMAQVTHFAAYNQETNRNTALDDVTAGQRTLHEIYLPAFEAAIERAGAASVMCADSSLNGAYSCENSGLLTRTLRDLWDFPGYVTSDSLAIHDLSAASAGTDMEQPENTYFGAPLQAAVSSNAIARGVLNTMVSRILTEVFRFGIIQSPPTGTVNSTVTTPAHQALGTEVAQTGATLLKDAGHTLPLPRAHAGTVAVIGPAALANPTDGGGGSAYVIPSASVTPLAGLQAAAGPGTEVTYTPGLPTDTSLPAIPSADLEPADTGTGFGGSYAGTLTAPQTGTYVLALTNGCHCDTPTYLTLDGRELLDDPGTPPVSTYSVAVALTAGRRYQVRISGAADGLTWATPSALAPPIAAAVSAARSAPRAVVVVSDDTESEATDRPSLALPSAQDELVAAVAAANPHTTVVLEAGAPVLMPWLSQAGAVLDAWYPGQSDGTALARILFGAVDPSGHLPVTFPAGLGQVPAAGPARFPGTGGHVLYAEGLDVGYRWYDARRLTPLFPFGFGLSYTRFVFSHLAVTPTRLDGTASVRVAATITNTGSRAGADVMQLYLGDPARAGEPPRQLAGFERVALRPGRSVRVTFTLAPRQTWWWDARASGWTQTPGSYRVWVGDSSALSGLPLRGSFVVRHAVGARRVLVGAPARVRAGHRFRVAVRLTPGGGETLPSVTLVLQLPDGWNARAVGPVTFTGVRPGASVLAQFTVVAPADTPASSAVVHASAGLGAGSERENGVTVDVTP
jgi:beta-glucosidase